MWLTACGLYQMNIGSVTFTAYPVILAPMEDITDLPFRLICKEHGADLMYTEFIASEGLIRDAAKSRAKLLFQPEERPIGVQIFGHDVNSMVTATRIAEEVEPDLIDINYGCPVRKVVNRGGGAALLKDIPRMVEMTRAVVNSTRLPVTVKTRLGWDQMHKDIPEIAEQLQDVGIMAITIHGRTRDQMYKGTADWALIGEVKNNPRMVIPVIGNGDVDSPEKALEMKNRYGVDGIMIGRAALGNPWIFGRTSRYLNDNALLPEPDLAERVRVCRKHLVLSLAFKEERQAAIEMRKFYSGYFRGIPHFRETRMKLLSEESISAIFRILEEIEQLT